MANDWATIHAAKKFTKSNEKLLSIKAEKIS